MYESVTANEKSKYFLQCIKYDTCIYLTGFLGVAVHILVSIYTIVQLVLGLEFYEEDVEGGASHYSSDMTEKGTIYSYLCVIVLLGTAISELLMIRAVHRRTLTYIQWWMFSTFMLFLTSMLFTVISGFTIFQNGLWITGSILFLAVRIPVQMLFVDCFTHTEILKE